MVYVVSHKSFHIPEDDPIYCPIYVGKQMKNYAEQNGFIWDGQGRENIAQKNSSYCELTALYWIWKNTKDEIVGLNHYRRYFLSSEGNIINGNEIKQILLQNDVILSRPLVLDCTVEQFYYKTAGYQKDLQKVKEIIGNLYPQDTHVAELFFKGHEMSYANMFVMRRKDFDKYCNWLFSILFKLEEDMDMDGYKPAETRVYGYLGELLLNVYVIKNQMKIKHLDLFNTAPISLKNRLKIKAKNIVKAIIYFPSGIPKRRRMSKHK